MGKKTLTNVHSLFELIERAPVSILRRFSGLNECEALARGMDWTQADDQLRQDLQAHIRHLKKVQREPAEREALRVLRLSSPRGASVLATAAQQLHDADLEADFSSQEGGEIGRAVWMRTHSDDTLRLFDVAESILNTGDIRGLKKLYDAFDVPCEDAPPFIWNDAAKKELETRLTTVMRLSEPCDVIHVQLDDEAATSGGEPLHYLVVRFAGDLTTVLQMRNRRRESFCYYPARDATIVYAPGRNLVEVCAHAFSSRASLANVLSQHGFKRPLSSRPLNRFLYDLTRFATGLKTIKPRIAGAKVERLYLAEMTALLGNTTHSVILRIDSTEDLQDVASAHWGNHPFARAEAILGVTLIAELMLEGETGVTQLPIVLSEPNRCSLQGERNPRLRRCGEGILEALGVLKPLHPGAGEDDPQLILQVARLIEQSEGTMDGIALAKLGINIDRLEDAAILTEGERINEVVIEAAEGERFTVKIEPGTDIETVHYRDPLTGEDIKLPARHVRKWRIDLEWLREQLVTSLGRALRGMRAALQDEEPLFLGEVELEGHPVAVYFASRLGHERHYGKVDTELRRHPRPFPGIVLTTTSAPFPFAGTNVVVPVEDVLSNGQDGTVIELERLSMCYRNGQLAAMGGTVVRLNVSPDGYSAMLLIPGMAPWKVTNKAKIAVLQRLVDAYASSTPHVNTKKLMEGTGCGSPSNLFSKNSPWREYLVKVKGAHAWQLRLVPAEEPVVEEDVEDIQDEVEEDI